LQGCVVACVVHAADGNLLFSSEDVDVFPELLGTRVPGRYVANVTVPGAWLNQGTYVIRLGCGVAGVRNFDDIDAFQIKLIDTGDHTARWYRRGYFVPTLPWNVERLKTDVETSAGPARVRTGSHHIDDSAGEAGGRAQLRESRLSSGTRG